MFDNVLLIIISSHFKIHRPTVRRVILVLEHPQPVPLIISCISHYQMSPPGADHTPVSQEELTVTTEQHWVPPSHSLGPDTQVEQGCDVPEEDLSQQVFL